MAASSNDPAAIDNSVPTQLSIIVLSSAVTRGDRAWRRGSGRREARFASSSSKMEMRLRARPWRPCDASHGLAIGRARCAVCASAESSNRWIAHASTAAVLGNLFIERLIERHGGPRAADPGGHRVRTCASSRRHCARRFMIVPTRSSLWTANDRVGLARQPVMPSSTATRRDSATSPLATLSRPAGYLGRAPSPRDCRDDA